MTWKYPRELSRIITINGGFDPCRDITEMDEMWDLTGAGWRAAGGYGLQWTQVAAPGAIGEYAHKFYGKIANGIGMWGQQGISLYRNTGFQYCISPYSPYYWKIRAEFRLRIEIDQLCTAGYLSHCLGFWLDRNVITYFNNVAAGQGTILDRMGVFFNKAMGKVAITYYESTVSKGGKVLTEVSQSLNYDQWYDIRIEWYFNWFNDPRTIHVDVWLDNSKIINYDVTWPDNWGGNSTAYQYNQQVGRCGPAINLEHEGVAAALSEVTGYFKDIKISQDSRFVEWTVEDNILQSGRVSHAKLKMVSDRAAQFGEGSDVNVWRRNSLSDTWEPRFRGIIREVDRPRRKIITVSAEGYETILYGENTQNISHTSQTAKVIIQDAINNPDKGEFDVSTYVETTTTTYSREYPQNPKVQILEEMSALEGFILFLDNVNFWHFESYRTNQLPIHLIYGSSKLREVKVTEVFVRRPNLIRVIGKGFTSQRELAVDSYASGSYVVRNFNRMDLTSQSEVDDALDYYCFLLNEPLRVVEASLTADHSLQKGNLMRLTDSTQGIKNQQFLIASVHCKSDNSMKLGLLEAKPHLPALISDLSKRTANKEGEMFPQDETVANPEFSVEGVATVNITGIFEIEFSATIERSGDLVITDELIDDLIELWNLETVTQPGYTAYGTGTTEPLFSDTALETETGRASSTVTYQENIDGTLYRTVQYELNVVNPTSITEIGLFNAAASGTMACRAVFASYSEVGSVTFRIKIRVESAGGFCYVSPYGRQEIVDWLYGGGVMVTHTHIAHYAFNDFIAPLPETSYRPSLYGFGVIWVPGSAGVGTYTRTKILDRNMIKLQFDYPDYDKTTDEGTDGSAPIGPLERFLAVRASSGGNEEKQLAVLFHRSSKVLSDYDGSKCKWIIWIKFVSGETEY